MITKMFVLFTPGLDSHQEIKHVPFLEHMTPVYVNVEILGTLY